MCLSNFAELFIKQNRFEEACRVRWSRESSSRRLLTTPWLHLAILSLFWIKKKQQKCFSQSLPCAFYHQFTTSNLFWNLCNTFVKQTTGQSRLYISRLKSDVLMVCPIKHDELQRQTGCVSSRLLALWQLAIVNLPFRPRLRNTSSHL